jgi:hypothetical protein
MKTHVRITLAIVFALALPCIAAAQGWGRDLLLFQVGAGLYFPSYPDGLESAMSYADSLPGVDRIQVAVDLALGFSISERAYIMARVDGGGDRISDSSGDYSQLNLYLFSLGARYYPYVTGLYLEADVGSSQAEVDISGEGSYPSDKGFGYGIAIGYDFNRRLRGFGLELEAKYDSLTIESEQYGAFMLTLNLCWK